MDFSKLVVYMADDDADDRYIMHKALREAAPSVTLIEAENGDDLLLMLDARSREPASAPVHLILLDMNMPKVNGLETLTAIRSNPALRHIPAVMMSTSAEPAQVAVAYQHGINGYIQKPTTYSHMRQIAQAIKICFLNAVGGHVQR
ncbi:MAG: response regulator [Bacteroidetes bacterium]|nr:response regulator [Fibrella sp.]